MSHSIPTSLPDDVDGIAEFSTPDDTRLPTSCQKPETGGRCYNPAGPENPPGGILHRYKSRSNQVGYMVCTPCKEYLDTKATTVTRQRPLPPHQPPLTTVPQGYTLFPVDNLAIRAGTNAAQRGNLIRPPVVAASSSSHPGYISSFRTSHSHITSPSKLLRGGPNVGIPKLPQPPLLHRYPGLKHPQRISPSPKGRQGSLQNYVVETFTLLCSVVCQNGGRKTSRVVFDIQSKGIPNVNASSTGPQLHAIVYQGMRNEWSSATFNYPLTDDMWSLRDKSGVDLVDSFPNTPALRDQCFTKGGRPGEQFGFGKTLKVDVMLTAFAYEMVEKHMDECRSKAQEYNDASALPNDEIPDPLTPLSFRPPLDEEPIPATPNPSIFRAPTAVAPRPFSTPERSVAKRAFITSPTSAIRSPPAKRIASVQKTAGASAKTSSSQLDGGKLQAALKLHGQQQRAALDASRTAVVHYFTVPEQSLSSLIEEPKPMDFTDPTLASHATILYNPANKDLDLGSGTFKLCLKGQLCIQPPPVSGLGSPGSTIVALKRPYTTPADGSNIPMRLPAGNEFLFIAQEAVVWRWASALLSLVYGFIDDVECEQNPDSPPIPQLRFVEIGVAKAIIPGTSSAHRPDGAFLVEEEIPSTQGFVRYIGNGSAHPLPFEEATYAYTVAQFCSFCQHVQWVLTEGKVYCADWQGGTSSGIDQVSLLTDPQVMTHPDVGGLLFADGNVPESFRRFPSEHDCTGNPYCEFYNPGDLKSFSS